MTLTYILSFQSKLHLTCQNAAQEKGAQRRDGDDMTQVKNKFPQEGIPHRYYRRQEKSNLADNTKGGWLSIYLALETDNSTILASVLTCL